MMSRPCEGIINVGVHDRNAELFESQYPVPYGMSYNSYLLLGEHIAVMDSVEKAHGDEWIANVRAALGGKKPDYLVVLHMEPDHSANILRFAQEFPEARVVGNAKTFSMMQSFYGTDLADRRTVVSDGDVLDFGGMTLKFIFAPMVHWPEVMTAYESVTRTLFSADAFGRFGTADADIPWEDEARRYYFGIVGKYGAQVQALLKKIAPLPVDRILSLHGPALEGGISAYTELYDVWSSYRPETEGVLIAYTSVYGNTAKAADELARLLAEKGVDVIKIDVSRTDFSYAVAEAFRRDRLVLASTTYNMSVFPPMKSFIGHLTERGFRDRRVGLIENGSWAPAAAKTMQSLLEGAKGLIFCENVVHVKSALDGASRAELTALAEELAR